MNMSILSNQLLYIKQIMQSIGSISVIYRKTRLKFAYIIKIKIRIILNLNPKLKEKRIYKKPRDYFFAFLALVYSYQVVLSYLKFYKYVAGNRKCLNMFYFLHCSALLPVLH